MAITIDQLNIELTANSQKASSAIDKLAQNLERLKTALGPLANTNIKVSNSFNTQTNSVNKASNAINKYANKANKAGKSSQSLAQKLAQKISTTEKGTEISPEDSDGSFYVLSVNTPEITGVLITASGADNADIKERILRGAKHALGVPYHKISVEWGK